MRSHFAQLVLTAMKKNERIWVVTGDLGYMMWDEIRTKFPQRFVNVGAAEQAMMGVGVGLALQGKIPLLYSITPFLLYRPFETIRNYVHHENVPLILVGSGRDKEYDDNGFSHWAEEDKQAMKIFSHISAHWPKNNAELDRVWHQALTGKKPYYINLSRF